MPLCKTFAAVLLLGFVPLLLPQTPRPAPKPAPSLTLDTASARGLIEYSFSGTGASSGDSIRLTVNKTAKAAGRTLSIDLPTGSILRSADPTSQNMVVSALRGVDMGGGRIRPVSAIYLRDNDPVTFILSAFCAEFEKANPPPGVAFTLQPLNPALACILNQARDLSMQARQAAVWIQTDSISYEHMRQKFQIGPGDWTAARSAVERCRSIGQ